MNTTQKVIKVKLGLLELAKHPSPPHSATKRPPGLSARHTPASTASARGIQCKAALLNTASNSFAKGRCWPSSTWAASPRLRAAATCAALLSMPTTRQPRATKCAPPAGGRATRLRTCPGRPRSAHDARSALGPTFACATCESSPRPVFLSDGHLRNISAKAAQAAALPRFPTSRSVLSTSSGDVRRLGASRA